MERVPPSVILRFCSLQGLKAEALHKEMLAKVLEDPRVVSSSVRRTAYERNRELTFKRGLKKLQDECVQLRCQNKELATEVKKLKEQVNKRDGLLRAKQQGLTSKVDKETQASNRYDFPNVTPKLIVTKVVLW